MGILIMRMGRNPGPPPHKPLPPQSPPKSPEPKPPENIPKPEKGGRVLEL